MSIALLLLLLAPHDPGARLSSEPAGRFSVGGEVGGLAVAADGSLVVAAGGRRLLLWDVVRQNAAPVALRSSAATVAFSPDRRGFYVGTTNGTLAAVTRAGQVRWEVAAGDKGVRAIAVSPDGALIATGTGDGRVRLWKAADGSLFRDAATHDRPVASVGFSAGGRRLLSCDDGAIKATQVFAEAPVTPPGDLVSETFGPFHVFAAAASEDHLAVVGQYRYQSKAGAFSSQAGGLTYDDRILVYHGGERKPEHTIRPEMPTDDIRGVALASDSRFLGIATQRSQKDKHAGSVIVWEIEREEPRLVVDLPAAGRAVALSADGRILAAGDSKGNVLVQRVVGMETDLADSPASAAVATAAENGCAAPQLRVEQPAGAAGRGLVSVAARSLLVQGTVKDPCGRGIDGVWVNGDRITSLEKDGAGGARFSAYVGLTAGAQEVLVRTVAATGAESSQDFRVQATPPSLSDPKGIESGGARAVAIGISRYQETGINLSFADRDARSFASALVGSQTLGRFNRQNVKVLLDEHATRQDIVQGLSYLDRAGPDEVAILFYAGHGAPAPAQAGGPEKLYLIPHDVRTADIPDTAYPMSEVQRLLRSVKARHLIVFVDACHSGGIGGEDLSPLGASRRLPGASATRSTVDINAEFLRRVEHAAPSRVVFASAEKSQVAYEPPELGAGVFTHFLELGLRGAADENGDRVVTLGELLEYVRASVRHYTKGVQVPAVSPTSFDRELPLAVVK